MPVIVDCWTLLDTTTLPQFATVLPVSIFVEVDGLWHSCDPQRMTAPSFQLCVPSCLRRALRRRSPTSLALQAWDLGVLGSWLERMSGWHRATVTIAMCPARHGFDTSRELIDRSLTLLDLLDLLGTLTGSCQLTHCCKAQRSQPSRLGRPQRHVQPHAQRILWTWQLYRWLLHGSDAFAYLLTSSCYLFLVRSRYECSNASVGRTLKPQFSGFSGKCRIAIPHGINLRVENWWKWMNMLRHLRS